MKLSNQDRLDATTKDLEYPIRIGRPRSVISARIGAKGPTTK